MTCLFWDKSEMLQTGSDKSFHIGMKLFFRKWKLERNKVLKGIIIDCVLFLGFMKFELWLPFDLDDLRRGSENFSKNHISEINAFQRKR